MDTFFTTVGFRMYANEDITRGDFGHMLDSLNASFGAPGEPAYTLVLENNTTVCFVFTAYMGDGPCPRRVWPRDPGVPVTPYKALRIKLLKQKVTGWRLDEPELVASKKDKCLKTCVVSGCGSPPWSTAELRAFAGVFREHDFTIKQIPTMHLGEYPHLPSW
jgi:hypothetical protein